jgi:uncharacterized SAM-binding protein YcdF (DUF218 family)
MRKRRMLTTIFAMTVALAGAGAAATWLALYLQGKRFALRDRLQHADAIVALAGTRGNIKFLDGKTDTAVRLYRAGWAPMLLFAGRFSAKVTDTPQLIPREELELAAVAGRIEQQNVPTAARTWDVSLGACYMRDRAIQLGVPAEDIMTERASLHTLENARFTAKVLVERGMRRVILVTSPFHQLRTYLTFAKVYQEQGIEIRNYYADTGEWHPLTWFLSAEHRQLVRGEIERIRLYRAKGDLL